MPNLTIAVPDPAAEAERYERILGTVATTGTDGSFSLAAGHARIVLETPRSLELRLGKLAPDPRDALGQPRAAYMAALTLRTESLGQTEEALRAGGMEAVRTGPTSLAVAAADAMNCALEFEASAP